MSRQRSNQLSYSPEVGRILLISTGLASFFLKNQTYQWLSPPTWVKAGFVDLAITLELEGLMLGAEAT